jgi:DNA ligase (NAD+)
MDNHQRPAHDENGNIIKTNDSFLDDPAPDVEFKDKTFVLTGVFTIADRSEVARMILERGGKTSKAVTRSTDYVVTAEVASSAYVNGNYGTKIKEAIELKKLGIKIAIISEQHFIKFIKDSGVIKKLDSMEIHKDIIEGHMMPFRQKDIPKEDRTFYGITLDQNEFYTGLPLEIIYNHSNMGIIKIDLNYQCYRDGFFIGDNKRYDIKRIIKVIDKRNGKELSNSELVEYIFKNLDDETLISLFIKGILKDMPSARALYNAGYRSLKEIEVASDDELLSIKGIKTKKLNEIREFFKNGCKYI